MSLSCTLQRYIGHDAFRVHVSLQWQPEGDEAFGYWMQHIDGTEMFYVRGVIRPSDGYTADTAAQDAFQTLNVCSHCVRSFSFGKVTTTDKYGLWTRESMLYQPHHSTTDRRPKPTLWSKPCCRCRERIALEAVEKCKMACEKVGYVATVTISQETKP